MMGPLLAVDGVVNAALAPFRWGWLVAAFAWLTEMGTGAAGVAIAIAASGLMAAGQQGGWVGPLWLTFVGAEATTWSLKFLIGRVRPVFTAGVTAGSPSFPSAHATVSMALYGFLGLAIANGLPAHRGGILAATAAAILAIGFSRIFLSLHYLSDVLAGYAIGAAWLWLGWRWAMRTG